MKIIRQAEIDVAVSESAAAIRAKSGVSPEVAVILGSGTGDFTSFIEDGVAVPFSDIPHFTPTTVPGHKGEIVLGKFGGKSVAVCAGRFHYYEGHSMHQVAYPVRVLSALGARILIQFNAAGGIKRDLQVGDLMVITDYINRIGDSPLRGVLTEPPAAKFVAMNTPFDRELCELAMRSAAKRGYRIHEGTYIAVHGPSYETDAELYFFHVIGGAAVGMSTVPEVIVGRSLGMRCLAVSVITNLTFGREGEHLSHRQVLDIARGALPKLKDILTDMLPEL